MGMSVEDDEELTPGLATPDQRPAPLDAEGHA
jgi:hypothetical protein